MTTPETTGLLEAALYADDLDAAERFYGQTLGLPVVLKMEAATSSSARARPSS